MSLAVVLALLLLSLIAGALVILAALRLRGPGPCAAGASEAACATCAACADDLDLLAGADEDEPVAKLALRTIEDAYARGAASVHVAPHEQATDGGPPGRVTRITYRVDGRLEGRMSLPAEALRVLVARLRAMAGLQGRPRALQRGRIDLRAHHPEAIDLVLDLATWRGHDGDHAVLHLLARGTLALGLDALDLHEDALARVRAAATAPRGGVLLLAGEVESGRTTTLHALAHEVERDRRVAFVAPDPYVPWVEGVDPASVQSLDADVLVVGELRDAAAARLAFAAAQEGRLVLATIFARDVGTAIARLVDDLQVSRHVLPACLRAVVAQRLCRRVCRCRADGAPPTACERCEGAGYKGRLGLHEVATVEGPLLAALRAGETAPAALQAAALAGGMTPLERDGARKAERGVTDLEAVRVALA
ncbi:MAG: Flp pilus assembly complex ATPase component TadA [Planctomycetes bacterium]|nr:Flp pilus assembly complex ATPase component TadA [Planctomycetota bacterium]